MGIYYPANPSGAIIPFAGYIAGPVSAPSGWLLCDGSAVSRTTYTNLFNAISPSMGTFTVTIASPAVVTLNGHGLQTGDAVYATTTGALPTGLSTNTIYYAIRIDANTFNLATSRANAYAATKINTSVSQSGTHTLVACPHGLGDGSTTFNVPDLRGRVLAGNDSMNGTVASRLTLPESQGVYGNLGATGGEQDHTLTSPGELPSHSHTFRAGGSAIGDMASNPQGMGATVLTNATDASLINSTGSSGAHNNVQPVVLVNHIIKT